MRKCPAQKSAVEVSWWQVYAFLAANVSMLVFDRQMGVQSGACVLIMVHGFFVAMLLQHLLLLS
jgi:hypothetical protein